MNCPHCDVELSPGEVRSLWGSLTNSLRKTRTGGRNGGRPAIPAFCKKCGKRLKSVREAAAHCRRPRRKL